MAAPNNNNNKNDWWNDPATSKDSKWKTLSHNGVLFPPAYKPHNIPLIYDGKQVYLSPEQEEMIAYFVSYLETDHVKKPKFRENFWNDFQKLSKSTPDANLVVKEFEKCDFSLIHDHVLKQKESRRQRTKEEREIDKFETQQETELFGFAFVDGQKEKVANFRVEPPGLFLGRGDHPKMGMWKRRVEPEDITLNLDENAKIPPTPIAGHHWGHIVHDHNVSWIACWSENINGAYKYVFLSISSKMMSKVTLKKYDVARSLKPQITRIRNEEMNDLNSETLRIKQRATALYLIDKLCLRVGNETTEDSADTIGCCTLRVQHIKLSKHENDNNRNNYSNNNNNNNGNFVELDFLGQDSMRYQNKFQVPDQVFQNLELFVKGKQQNDSLFDELTPTLMNTYLSELMSGLTAKVFRTFNSSFTFQQELSKMNPNEQKTLEQKILFYNQANKQVAILCNHIRSVPNSFPSQMADLETQISDLERYLWDLENSLDNENSEKKTETTTEKKRRNRKRKHENLEEKDESEQENSNEIPKDRNEIRKMIEKVESKIHKLKFKQTEKHELKEIALGTSKINYIDPRITIAWCKKFGVPIEKIFSKTLREKFDWAMDADTSFEF